MGDSFLYYPIYLIKYLYITSYQAARLDISPYLVRKATSMKIPTSDLMHAKQQGIDLVEYLVIRKNAPTVSHFELLSLIQEGIPSTELAIASTNSRTSDLFSLKDFAHAQVDPSIYVNGFAPVLYLIQDIRTAVLLARQRLNLWKLYIALNNSNNISITDAIEVTERDIDPWVYKILRKNNLSHKVALEVTSELQEPVKPSNNDIILLTRYGYSRIKSLVRIKKLVFQHKRNIGKN